ncbi:unnamed protein product [Adineta ricciae]|uniref:G-protein coupled receptors family 1 profile domain-containing protein n=1 Tax=Adineta ricciae TaxID=249248 RepID=A0A816AZ89_ADIRI|nr:unnamed protein product [Adineta ricciae]CAF1604029.1 unnamed protein product [Adineta ricciae]
MSNSLANLLNTLNTITIWTSRIIPIFHLIFGTFGNVFNIIIFTRPALRTNPCSMYFLAGSINNIIFIYSGIFVRYMIDAWNLDITLTSVVICKFRQYISACSFALYSWFIVLASIDRFLSSSKSAQLRQLSSLSIARKVILLTIIIMLLFYSLVLFFFAIDLNYSKIACYIPSIQYNAIYFSIEPLISVVIPVLLQTIFGILLIVNVRSMHNRVVPIGDNARNERQRSNDRQLIKMHLLQVLMANLLLAPYVAITSYNSIAITILKQPLSIHDQTIVLFTLTLARYFASTNPVISFYLYTLSGPKFRNEFKRCSRHGFQVILRKSDFMRCLPMRIQQVVRNENQTNTNTQFTERTERRNNVHPVQRY